MKNTVENQQMWIKKIHDIMIMGGKSEYTFKNYRCAINNFLNYFSNDTDFKDVDEDVIFSYIQDKFINQKRASSTINVAICSIRFFYSVCFKISLNKDLLPNCKLAKIIPSYLPKEDFIVVFNNETTLLRKCQLLLAFCSGLRASEIATLRIENIFADEHKLKVLGKGKKERFTFLPDITIKFLRLYCKYHNITKKTGYLFEGYKERPVSRQAISGYFNTKLRKKYDFPETITFHSLRHSFATYYLLSGGDLITLQHMMGHTNISSTRIYIHFLTDYNHLT